MIKRIELTNFMSHVHTVIEPAAGLTVLVGPNNCGKSAVVAALQILCRNDNSTYVLRHGQRECSVKVECDEGHVIEWRRKDSPSYKIDNKTFDRLKRGGLPDELHQALRLPKVEAGDETDFDVHFGTQKSPIFLLGSSSSTAARFFASSSDAIRLVQMQKRHKEKLQDAQREKRSLEEQSAQLSKELAALEPAVELDQGLKRTEQAYCNLVLLSEEIDLLAENAAAIAEQSNIVARHQSEADSLAVLQMPPQLAPVEDLVGLIQKLEQAQREERSAAAHSKALEALPPPLELRATDPLECLCRQMSDLVNQATISEQQHAALAALASPPQYQPTEPLDDLIRRLSAGTSSVAACEECWAIVQSIAPPAEPLPTTLLESLVSNLEKADAEVVSQEAQCALAGDALDAARTELQIAAEGTLCPVCGGPLDADRLLAAAATGGGGHGHD